MPRRTNAAYTAEKLDEATAEAARVLTDALAAYGAILQDYVKGAHETGEYTKCVSYLDTAGGLVESMTKLAGALGQVRSELRQTVRVQRPSPSVRRGKSPRQTTPNDTLMAPLSAPNEIAHLSENFNESRDIAVIHTACA